MRQYMGDSLPLNLDERHNWTATDHFVDRKAKLRERNSPPKSSAPRTHRVTSYLVAVQIRQANWAKFEADLPNLDAFDRLFIEQHRVFGSPGFVLD